MSYLDNGKLWSKEAEAAVLGSMIIDSKCIAKILPVLSGESFFDDQNKIIYTALINLYTANAPIDPVVLRTELKSQNQLEAVGGVEYLSDILDSVPSSANAEYYAGIVRERERYRKAVNITNNIQAVFDECLSVDEQIQKIQELALSIESGRKDAEYFPVSDYATKVTPDICNCNNLIKTGFNNVDKIINGVAAGELIILAARPSVGKSALALGMALNMAKAGKSVVFFTLEMRHQALIERAVCSMANVDSQNLKTDNPNKEDFHKVCAEALKLEQLDIVFHEAGSTIEQQIAFIRTWKKVRGVDVVFIDYLQLMSAKRAENRVQEISTISRKLKLATGREQIPIIALSQLNRKVEDRTYHRPRLSDLRESGSLEQDADIVLLLHREDYYRHREKPDIDDSDIDGEAELIVAKNRRGKTGIARLTFLEEYARFGDVVTYEESMMI